MRALACALLAWCAANAPSPRARAAIDAAGFEALVSAFQTRLGSLGRQDNAPPGMLAAFALLDGRDITLRMLLNHSSGIPDHVET